MKSQAIKKFLDAQQIAIAEEFINKGSTCFSALTSARLMECSQVHRWAVSNLPGFKPTSVRVIQKPEMAPELWARIGYRGYRKAFHFFMQQHYGFTGKSLPHDLQIDHIYPSFGFPSKKSDSFVRLALIDSRVNASFGAGFEKLLCKRAKQRKVKHSISLTCMAFLKVRGIRPPKKNSGQDAWKVWAWRHAKSLEPEGFDAMQVYLELSLMLNETYLNNWRPLGPHASFISEAQSYPSYENMMQQFT